MPESPIAGNVTVGSAVFNYSVPPGADGLYDSSAVVFLEVEGVKSQQHLFTPTNPNWQQAGIAVGNSTVDLSMTYTAPVPDGQFGNITLNSGKITKAGQSPQQLDSTTLLNWDTSGTVS
jgi:hypothetical protein